LHYRIKAAHAAASYCHRKMPIAIEGDDADKPLVFDASLLTGLTTREKRALLALFDKMALFTPKPVIEVSAESAELRSEIER
jgi:hypothetical protein